MHYYLDFEKPVAELENKIEELKRLADGKDMNITSEIKKLEKKARDLRADIFSKITPWQKTLVARHPERPYTLDYIRLLMEDFVELHGDRGFADDPSIVAGFAKFNNISIAVIGHQKGRGTKERIERNFGQPHPEGYRKTLRIMKLAEKFNKAAEILKPHGMFCGYHNHSREFGTAPGTDKTFAELKKEAARVEINEIADETLQRL